MLRDYNKKRNFNKTKEPIGKKSKKHKTLRFCIQHHIARKDHYDFRLEWNGVLKSFAIPKGPSYNPKDKRLAIMVEDHPLDYANFEGIIPKGEYGGGTVMLWDYGRWKPIENTKPDFKNGPIKFEVMGKRIKGLWTLVKIEEDNWLLIKDIDEYHLYNNINKFNTSIKTGRTMAEIADISTSINLTNPDKIIFDNPKITKEEIFNYYKVVANRMIPLIKDRLISTVRAPGGIKNGTFYKKHIFSLEII